ncbi:MAG: class I SAM-dependent methyltransferase [Planctomycetes bacterium]|nr:class I SAM-dependent methyltransferase [Planctomycetota bacterium]
MSDTRRRARELRDHALAAGEPTAWFERLYAHAGEDPASIPWADLAPNPHLVEWCEREGARGPGRALKVGCGLGDDAEYLSSLGFDVTAFDVAPTAIAHCRARFPSSRVDYRVADLLAPEDLPGEGFDLVVEAYTLQVLPPEVHAEALARVAAWVRPGGRLLLVCRGREPGEACPSLHWPLTRPELQALTSAGLREERFEDYLDDEVPPVRRFRVTFAREPG